MAKDSLGKLEQLTRAAEEIIHDLKGIDLEIAFDHMFQIFKSIDKKLWFDPSETEGCCMWCDANTFEKTKGKHVQVNGGKCPLQVIHDAVLEMQASD